MLEGASNRVRHVQLLHASRPLYFRGILDIDDLQHPKV